MFRHGLRVTEACEMRWDAISLLDKEIFITRKKGSDNGVHPLPADEVEALTKL
ncbi:phage integrase family protein [Scytonema sp. HK-05]|nr:phage integrase family protein [Scytonema sp. HK-05]